MLHIVYGLFCDVTARQFRPKTAVVCCTLINLPTQYGHLEFESSEKLRWGDIIEAITCIPNHTQNCVRPHLLKIAQALFRRSFKSEHSFKETCRMRCIHKMLGAVPSMHAKAFF